MTTIHGSLNGPSTLRPNADKLSQVREQRRLTPFMLLPDVFLHRYRGWEHAQASRKHRDHWRDNRLTTPYNTRRYFVFRDLDTACRLYRTRGTRVCL